MSVTGQSPVSYFYDNASRLTGISQGSANVTFWFDSDGRRTSLTLPNGIIASYTYDAASQLTGINYQGSAIAPANLAYTYDLDGRRIGVSGSLASTQLPAAVSSAVYNADNQLTQWGATRMSYDANGNTLNDGTNSYVWDARNRLVSADNNAASFTYDPLGRRVNKSFLSSSTNFLYDGTNAVQELNGTTPTANLLTGGIDERFARTTATETDNYLTDALGSTVELTNSAGALEAQYSYGPYGDDMSITGSTTNSYTYTGRETDGLGINYYRARYYNPNTGRFLSEDPLEFDGGDVNLYRYVWNAPTDFVDPTGQIGFGVSAGVAAEGGLVVVGTGAQGSVGAGGFVNTSNGNVSAGAFKSGGAFAGGVVPVLGSWGVSAPSQPSNANWAFGAYAGGGAGLWLSNANSVGDLSGPFYTTSFNLAWKFRALTLNLSVGKNACGQTIWIFNYGGPLGNIPTGGGFGGSLSGYNTNTVTTGRACACKGN